MDMARFAEILEDATLVWTERFKTADKSSTENNRFVYVSHFFLLCDWPESISSGFISLQKRCDICRVLLKASVCHVLKLQQR